MCKRHNRPLCSNTGQSFNQSFFRIHRIQCEYGLLHKLTVRSGRMGAWTGQGQIGPLRATSTTICTCPRPLQRPTVTHSTTTSLHPVSWVAPVASRMCSAKPLSFSNLQLLCSTIHFITQYALPIFSAHFWVSAAVEPVYQVLHCRLRH